MNNLERIEQAGLNYDKIIFEEDILPRRIYEYQIKKRNEKIAQLAEKSSVALDVGCGTGFHTVELTKKFKHVISTDVSFNAVKNTKIKISNLGLNNMVDFLVCDGSKIPLKTSCVDFTWVSGVLHHIPKKIPECISGISRITRSQILFDEPNRILLWYIIMKLSKADPVGNETPLDAQIIVKELKKNGFEKFSVSYWGFLVQFALLLKINFSLRFLETIENKMEKFLGRRFYLRWTITSKKNRCIPLGSYFFKEE